MRLRNLSYVTLWAVNFDQEKNLYKEILGLPVAQENDNFIMFDTKGSRLAFHLLKKGSRLDRQTVELHFEVDDVDEVYSAVGESHGELSRCGRIRGRDCRPAEAGRTGERRLGLLPTSLVGRHWCRRAREEVGHSCRGWRRRSRRVLFSMRH